MMFEHDIYYTTIFLQCGVWIVLPLCLLWCKNTLDIVLNFIWGNSSCDVNPQKAAFMELQVQSYLGGSNVCVVWGMVVSEGIPGSFLWWVWQVRDLGPVKEGYVLLDT